MTRALKDLDRDAVAALKEQARIIRTHVVRMVAREGQGYIQQGLGAADLLTALYFHELRLDPTDPEWPDRDRFLLSTAHNSALFHATLAQRGLIPVDDLATYCDDGSRLEINTSERLGPLVEATCGSLGQALSVAVGMALSAKRRSRPSRFYVVLGDGELQEGQLWEAAFTAAHWKLGNLVLIVDDNDMQVEGSSRDVSGIDSASARFAAFGWNTLDIDGNDMVELLSAFESAKDVPDKPTVINATTLPGKGVDFLEGQRSHQMVLPPEVAERALAILEEV